MFALANRLHLAKNKSLCARCASVLARPKHKASIPPTSPPHMHIQKDAIPTDPLQFILGPASASSTSIRTASEARARAKQHLDELQLVVVNANRILDVLERREKQVNQKIRDYRLIMGGTGILLGGSVILFFK